MERELRAYLAADLPAPEPSSFWRCPAPSGDGPCLNPLPCRVHDVSTFATGLFGYGNAYFATGPGTGPIVKGITAA